MWNPAAAWTPEFVEEVRPHFAYMTVDSPPEERRALGITDEQVEEIRHQVHVYGPEAAAHLIPDSVVERFAVVGDRGQVVTRLQWALGTFRPEIIAFGAHEYSVDHVVDIAALAGEVGLRRRRATMSRPMSTSAAPLRFGISISNEVPVSESVALARRAEELGLAEVWLPESGHGRGIFTVAARDRGGDVAGEPRHRHRQPVLAPPVRDRHGGCHSRRGFRGPRPPRDRRCPVDTAGPGRGRRADAPAARRHGRGAVDRAGRASGRPVDQPQDSTRPP